MDCTLSRSDLNAYEESKVSETRTRDLAMFGLAFDTQRQVDRQRLYTATRLGNLRSSRLSLEVFENRLESIDWTDILNQEEHNTEIASAPYRLLQKEML